MVFNGTTKFFTNNTITEDTPIIIGFKIPAVPALPPDASKSISVGVREFIKRIRGDKKFDSLEKLKTQIKSDIKTAKEQLHGGVER